MGNIEHRHGVDMFWDILSHYDHFMFWDTERMDFVWIIAGINCLGMMIFWVHCTTDFRLKKSWVKTKWMAFCNYISRLLVEEDFFLWLTYILIKIIQYLLWTYVWSSFSFVFNWNELVLIYQLDSCFEQNKEERRKTVDEGVRTRISIKKRTPREEIWSLLVG